MNRLTFYLDITAASGSTITAGPVQHTLGKGACGRRQNTQAYVGEGADDDRKASPQTLILQPRGKVGWGSVGRACVAGLYCARGSGGKTKDKHAHGEKTRAAVGNPMVSEQMDSDHHSSTPRFLPHHIKIMKVALVGDLAAHTHTRCHNSPLPRQ